MIDALACKMAHRIKSVVPEHPASVARLSYSLTFMLNAGFIILLSLLVSLLTGNTIEALAVLVSFAVLRQVSGGLHLKSGTLCVIASVVGVTLLSYTNIHHSLATPIITGISLVLVLFYAPSGIEKQTRIPPKYYPFLKALSITFVASNFLIASSVVAVTFFIQSLTLIPWFLMRGGEKNEEETNV